MNKRVTRLVTLILIVGIVKASFGNAMSFAMNEEQALHTNDIVGDWTFRKVVSSDGVGAGIYEILFQDLKCEIHPDSTFSLHMYETDVAGSYEKTNEKDEIPSIDGVEMDDFIQYDLKYELEGKESTLIVWVFENQMLWNMPITTSMNTDSGESVSQLGSIYVLLEKTSSNSYTPNDTQNYEAEETEKEYEEISPVGIWKDNNSENILTIKDDGSLELTLIDTNEQEDDNSSTKIRIESKLPGSWQMIDGGLRTSGIALGTEDFELSRNNDEITMSNGTISYSRKDEEKESHNEEQNYAGEITSEKQWINTEVETEKEKDHVSGYLRSATLVRDDITHFTAEYIYDLENRTITIDETDVDSYYDFLLPLQNSTFTYENPIGVIGGLTAEVGFSVCPLLKEGIISELVVKYKNRMDIYQFNAANGHVNDYTKTIYKLTESGKQGEAVLTIPVNYEYDSAGRLTEVRALYDMNAVTAENEAEGLLPDCCTSYSFGYDEQNKLTYFYIMKDGIYPGDIASNGKFEIDYYPDDGIMEVVHDMEYDISSTCYVFENNRLSATRYKGGKDTEPVISTYHYDEIGNLCKMNFAGGYYELSFYDNGNSETEDSVGFR